MLFSSDASLLLTIDDLFLRYGVLFLKHIAEDIDENSSTFSGDYNWFFELLVKCDCWIKWQYNCKWALSIDGVPKEGLRIEDVLVRIAVLMLVQEKVSL